MGKLASSVCLLYGVLGKGEMNPPCSLPSTSGRRTDPALHLGSAVELTLDMGAADKPAASRA